MEQASSPKRSSIHRINLLVFLSILGMVAYLQKSSPTEKVRVTISGLHPGLEREKVESKLGPPDFNAGRKTGPVSVEYWSFKEKPRLQIYYDKNNRVQRIEGGHPEIDGIRVSNFDLQKIRHRLGPPSSSGRSGPVGERGRGFLGYAEHEVLIQREGAVTSFLLFRTSSQKT